MLELQVKIKILTHHLQFRPFLQVPVSVLSSMMKWIKNQTDRLLFWQKPIALLAKKKSVEVNEKAQVTEKPSYTAQAQIQHIHFWGETASWSSTTLQQISSLEHLVLQALLYFTLLDFCFGLFWFLEPNVPTTFAAWGCLKESYPKSLCCLLCWNAILAAVMCKKPSSTLVLSHMEANHISAPVHSGVTPSCVSPHHAVTPHWISLQCWAQLPAMQKENTREGVPIMCLAHHFTFSECRRYPWATVAFSGSVCRNGNPGTELSLHSSPNFYTLQCLKHGCSIRTEGAASE